MRACTTPEDGCQTQEMKEHAMEKPRILIVDDNDMLTDMWRVLFEQTRRFEIGIENNGMAVLETARAFRPDLIFMDVCLPGKGGGEIAEELAADPVLKSTPIVFLTGISKEEAAERYGSGQHMVLTKPVRLHEILACAELFFPETVLKVA